MRQKASLTTMTTNGPITYALLAAAKVLASIEHTATSENEIPRLPFNQLLRLLPNLSRCDKKNLRG